MNNSSVPRALINRRNVPRDLVSVLPLELLLDYLAVRLNADQAANIRMEIEWFNRDTGERWAMTLENATLTYLPGAARGALTARITLGRASLAGLQADKAGLSAAFARLVAEGEIELEGDAASVTRLLGMLEEFDSMFNIVEP